MWITLGKNKKKGLARRAGGATEPNGMPGRERGGFTLIELLIVIAIIGILTTVATVSLVQARQRARDTKRVADLQQLRNALVIYSNQRATYPPVAVEGGLILGQGDARCLDDSDRGFHAGTAADPCAGLIIMQNVPAEQYPNHTEPRYFFGGPAEYRITFELEDAIGNLEGGDCTATQDGISCP